MKRLVFTDSAEQDFEAIGDYIAQSNPRRASAFVQDIRESCATLIAMPERYALLSRHKSSGIRHRVHGNYLIFYRVTEETVEILHVLHGAMDYDQVLFPDEE